MFIRYLMNSTSIPVFLMNEAGEGGGGGGDGAATGATNATATADGQGGKASLMTEGHAAENKGTQAENANNGNKLDLNALLGDDLAKNQNIVKFMNNENPVQAMAKSLVEAQSMIGKPKYDVPDANASDEAKAAFWTKMGVPDKAEGYGFAKPDNIPDDLWSQEHADKWAGLLKQHNIPKSSAEALRNEMLNEAVAEETAINKALTEAMTKSFGDRTEIVRNEISDFIQEAIPDLELRAAIQAAVGNKNAPVFALALGLSMQHMKKTYGIADKNIGQQGDGIQGKSAAEMREEGRKLMDSDAYKNPMHKDHADTKRRVDDYYSQAGRLTDDKGKR